VPARNAPGASPARRPQEAAQKLIARPPPGPQQGLPAPRLKKQAPAPVSAKSNIPLLAGIAVGFLLLGVGLAMVLMKVLMK
jgi:hypothetical protein